MKRISILIALFAFAAAGLNPVWAKSDEKRKQEILRKMEELRKKQEAQRTKLDETMQKVEERAAGNIGEEITRWESIVARCSGDQNERCAMASYSLANLYYDEARERFLTAQKQFEKMLDRWEKNKAGPPPVSPIPHYEKAISTYEKLIKEYPDFTQRDNALYRVGGIYLQSGKLDESYKAFKELVDKYPRSQFTSQARLRVGDHLYMRNQPFEAIEYFRSVTGDVGVQNYALAQFRVASCLFAMSQYQEAIAQYFSYIERCDSHEFPTGDFRDEAILYMARAFAEVRDPIGEARSFFKGRGGRPYERDVYYQIGKSCRENDKNKEAVAALEFMLESYPDYWHAPDIQRMIIETQVVMRDFRKANESREHLIDKYGTGSKWLSLHQSDPKALEEARKVTESELALIPLYYHEQAQKEKNPALFEKAARRYKQYIDQFPGEKWTVYEYSFNLAGCLTELKRYEEAAEYYDRVANASPETFGPRRERALDDTTKKAKQVEIKPEDAGNNAIIAYQLAWESAKANKGLSNKEAFDLPVARKLREYAQTFAARFPKSSVAPDVMFLVANMAYDSERYTEASTLYRQLLQAYPGSKDAPKITRMLAQSNMLNGDYDQAIRIYKDLLNRTKSQDPEYEKLQNSIASAMYKIAEKDRTANPESAAAQFVSIAAQYPGSQIADIAMFDAASLYEQKRNYGKAAETFLQVGLRFPKSKHATASFGRAADAYAKVPDYNKAAKVYETFIQKFPKEKDVDKVLYNAGLTYERAKNYSDAIRVYQTVGRDFPKSEYAADALYSIALIYETQKNYSQMIATFKQYIAKYSEDKYKLVQASAKLGEAYFQNKNYSEAAGVLDNVVEVYTKFRKKADMDPAIVAKAQYYLAEIKFQEFAAVKLEGSKSQVNDQMKKKEKLLKEVTAQYAEAIKQGIEEWTLRATYSIGLCFVELGNSILAQPLKGSVEEKIAGKINVLEVSRQFFVKSEEYFGKNIELGFKQGIRSEWVRRSEDKFLEMRYMQANLFEQAGALLRSAPVPKGLDQDERQLYAEELEEKSTAFRERALPIYESALKAAVDFNISQSPWIAKIRKSIAVINPASEALALKPVASSSSAAQARKVESRFSDADYQQALRRIQGIMAMEIPTEDKIKQLQRIEREALRQVEMEEVGIRELRARDD